MTQTSQRVNAIQDQVFWFTGALENVLGRICLDDRQLVPEPMRIEEAHSGALPTKSVSPSTSGLMPMDEDETDSAVGSITFPGTHTTTSDLPPDFRMADVRRAPVEHMLDPAADLAANTPDLAPATSAPARPAPAKGILDWSPAIVALAEPTVNVIPATLQGSQTKDTPAIKEGDTIRVSQSDRPNTRSRSRSKPPT
jgi:hypothetical protein